MEVETDRPAECTHASALARTALAAAVHPPGNKTPTLKGESFASRVVTPTLAAAGLGWYVGGAPTALAVMRADYASGPGLAYPLETLQALALCSLKGIMIRDPDSLEQLDKVDVLLLDHHPALEATEPEVAGVRVFPGQTEYQVLRLAASAFRNLDDDRSQALRAAARERRIALIDRVSIEYGADVTVQYKGQVIKVGNLGSQGPATEPGAGDRTQTQARSMDSLMVGVNGQIAGLIDFRYSSRLSAATAIRELRSRMARPLAIGLISETSEVKLRQVAGALGVDFHQGGLAPAELLQLIRGCKRRGLKVAFAGFCLAKPLPAREADVAISLDPDGLENLDRNPAQILLLRPDLSRLGVLQEVTRLHNRRIRVAQGSALIPNLFCVAGAILFGFSSLTTVVISNLGTYSTYARTIASIRQLERQLSRPLTRRPSHVGA
jgi:cation transport ATPase